mmetsp:Transcript_30690/g.75294  ORF Transcript_30690/g.75294 Transcript_30690/m.75294 type:complete len:109 (+) Transcript_30690:88-414(+)
MSPNGRRLRTATTRTEVELLRLTKDALKKLLIDRGELRKQFRKYAVSYIEMVKRESQNFKSGLANERVLLLALNNWMFHTRQYNIDYADQEQEWRGARHHVDIPQTIS